MSASTAERGSSAIASSDPRSWRDHPGPSGMSIPVATTTRNVSERRELATHGKARRAPPEPSKANHQLSVSALAEIRDQEREHGPLCTIAVVTLRVQCRRPGRAQASDGDQRRSLRVQSVQQSADCGSLAPMKLGVTDGLHLRPGLVQPALSLTGQGLIDDRSPFEGLVD